ncbi:hypothetical protein PybrP1_012984 [[Pythium] brassicae (nom. inval.)]|nr:hypothetical protein PybrP1_012984 [[Pythium] brassicae (nom. inval.)]
MVRKASRLPPNATSLEEVLLQRAVDGDQSHRSSSAGPATGSRRRRSTARAAAPSAAVLVGASVAHARLSMTAAMSAASGGGARRNASLSLAAPPVSSATAPAASGLAGTASIECMTQLAGDVAALDKRVRSLAASTSGEAARPETRDASGRDTADRTRHQRAIERLVQQSMDDVHAATRARQAAAAAAAATVASGDTQRQVAATKIAMLGRAFVTRRRFLRFERALGAWRARKCAALLAHVEQFAAREAFLNRQVAAMRAERTRALLRRVLAELRDVVLMHLPLRARRAEETERQFQRKRRALVRSVFAPWKRAALGPRSRKTAAADAAARHRAARQRLEALGRFEVVTAEMAHDEFLKDNIRTVRGRHPQHVLRLFFRLLVAVEFAPAQLRLQRALAHDRRKRLARVWGAWLPLFRAAQVDKAIARVSERRTLERFDRHHNLRRIDAHYRRVSARRHLRAWAQYGQRIRRVRRLFEDTTKENLARLLRKWHLRAGYQHTLRANAAEEWRAYSRRIFQTPFRCWYVFAVRKKTARVAKDAICVAYERRQRRHDKYRFFRLWQHQVLFGSVEGIHSKTHLLRSLEDQKRMCLGLEASARLHEANVAALRASVAQIEAKLAEKQLELAALHDATQSTRFGMHAAEQNIARVQGMLEAVRSVHPGTVDRIEKIYKESPLLSRDLKDVVGLHESKRKELIAKIELDETELEVHNARSSSAATGAGSQDDQLLLHRVKWVLSRLDLQQMRGSDTDAAVRASAPTTDSMNQLCALFEFIRSGDTSVLTPENNPLASSESSASASGGALVRRRDLFEKSASWHAFVQALTVKFVPDRMLSVRERLVKRAARMDSDVAAIKASPHIYNLYSGAAQAKARNTKSTTEEP